MLVGTEAITVEQGGYVVVPAGVHHAFAAGPGIGAGDFITLVPGVELARVHEQYDVHFVDSPLW